MAAARKPGWWYPYIFVAGFVVVIAVNGTLAYFATTTFTGLETEQPYEKGLAYNQNLAMAKAQEQLGWTVDLAHQAVPGGATPRAKVTVSYRDRDGKPIDGLSVRAAVVRPTVKGYDHEVVLPALGNGQYGATLDLALDGVWDLDVIALGRDAAYEFGKRIVVQ